MEITIPTSWQDITIGQYIKLRPVLKAELNPIERVINIIDAAKGIGINKFTIETEKESF